MLARRLSAEALGTALLLAVVIGSGIMGERLFPESDGLALLANTLATGAGLTALILTFGPISGAHFNPAVTLAFALGRQIAPGAAAAYVCAQLVGGVAGAWLAHAMFAEPVLQVSTQARDGAGLLVSEAVATFGLVATILACARHTPTATAYAVGLYISAAYWFTASTSFANPAVTVARALSDTFAGIAPHSAPGFIAAQGFGAAAAALVLPWMLKKAAPA